MEELKPLTRDEIEKKIEMFYNALKPYVKNSGFFMSVMLGQVGIESYWGTSTLAKKANNFTGHKFKAPFSNVRPNDYFIKDAGEEVDGEKVVYEDEKWRKYRDVDDWAKHHADWLTQSDWYKNHYKDSINAKTPEEQLKALTNVYATDSNYATKVMKVINEYGLKKYDQEQVEEVKDKGEDKEMAFPKPKMIDRRTRALGYPGRGAYAKRSKSAIKNIVWHYTATVHAGYGENIIKNHENYWRNTHGWDIGGYHYYIDRQGNIFWNYDLEKVSYGAGKLNPSLMHISLEASSPNNYTAAQVKAREDLTLWLLTNDLKHLTASAIRGHKEIPYNSTTCPGYSVAQLNAFRNNLGVKLKSGSSTSTAGSNPQGLTEIKIPAYQATELPYKTFQVGDTVTLKKDFRWYNPSNNTLLISKKEDELEGKKDKIAEIRDIEDVGTSRYAYRLQDTNSWILEEFLVESTEDWVEIDNPEKIKVPEYREPTEPFLDLKVGQEVTIRVQTQNWFIPSTKEWVAPTVDIKGQKDKILKVIDIEGGASYSKKAYLLERFYSWVLEQDLEEARKTHEENVTEDNEPEEIVPEVVEEGVFHLDGKWYKINELDK